MAEGYGGNKCTVSMETYSLFSAREIENTLDEMALAEQDEFEKS